MARSFYRLKDKGTTFYDMMQGAGLVSDRIAPLQNTARVQQAVRDGVIEKLDVEEGKAAFAKQQKALAKELGKEFIEEQEAAEDARPDVTGDGSNVIKTLEGEAAAAAKDPEKTSPSKANPKK